MSRINQPGAQSGAGDEPDRLPGLGPSKASVADAKERAALLARCYDLDFLDVSYDAELYLRLAQEADGPVLELAVGSGRLAIPLALAGHDVLGIDLDRAMLTRAATAWRRARGSLDKNRLVLRQADMRTFRSSARFGLTFLAVNTLLLMADDAARLAVLGTMLTSLRQGGIAAADISTPSPDELAEYDGTPRREWTREDPASGDQVTKIMQASHDPDRSTVTLRQTFECVPAHGGPLQRISKTDRLHLLSSARLAELAHEAGFGDIDVRGDHLTSRYGARSHRAVLVARRV